MKIYILTLNEVQPDPPIIYSNYRAPRHERKIEYFASREGAEARQKEIYEGMNKLVGFIGNIEAVISENELKP